MKINFGLNGQILNTSDFIADKGSIPLFEFFRSFESRRNFSPSHLSHSSLLSKTPEKGLILTTSGTQGERKWIFHPWKNIESRTRSLVSPAEGNALFLSCEHAAGLEMAFRHYLHDMDFGLYPPSCSPLEAYKALQHQKAQSLTLTPSTFLRFLNYPLLRNWIRETITSISFGGESLSEKLITILREDFSHVQVKSVYGTTESWSLKTDGLQWHSLNDPEVDLLVKNGKLLIRSPYLFTHSWNGSDFVQRTEDFWMTGDEVEFDENQAFRIKNSVHQKYHGLKVYPLEWSDHLSAQFDLAWMQIKANQNHAEGFTGIVPEEKKGLITELEEEVRKQSWPIFNWIYQSGPETSFRGKERPHPDPLISGHDLRKSLFQLSRESFKLVFLEEATLADKSQFHFLNKPHGVIFYLDYLDRKLLQYMAKDFEALLSLIKDMDQPNLQIKLPHDLSLDPESWEELGTYRSWALDLQRWSVSQSLQRNWGQFIPSLGKRFDHLLEGAEARMLSSLSDTMGVYGQDQDGEGLCSFRMVEGVYNGIYLTNKGLSRLKFLRLCAHGLSKARAEGIKKAQSAVEVHNKAAEFLHETLGFEPSSGCYKVWKRRGP